MRGFIGGRVVLSMALMLAWTPAWGQMRTELFQGQEVAAGDVLVKFRPGDAASAAPRLSSLGVTEVRAVGGTGALLLHSRSKSVESLLNELATSVDVVYAEPNYIVHAFDRTPNDPFFPQLWGLQNTGQDILGEKGAPRADVGAAGAWDITTGSRAYVVAVVDTGIDYNHPDLAPNIWSAPGDFTVTFADGSSVTCAAGTHGFNAIADTCDPLDDHDHGTHVSGTIGAKGNNGTGVVGVNWTASLMGLKFLSASGAGTTANAIKAIEFAVQAKATFHTGANVRVLSNSWGWVGFSQALFDEIVRANDNGMLFVAASGDFGINNDLLPVYPASYNAPNVISVAATDSHDGLASFSDYGARSVHLAAPGVNILSTIRDGGYEYYYGTSQSAPYVSGAAALVLSACPVDTPSLKQTLLDSVDLIDSLRNVTVTGGRLNVNAALRACMASQSAASAP